MKTITFALMHFTIAFSVVYLVTGSIALGGVVAVIEPLLNTVGYFFHEKAWDKARRRKNAAQFTPAGHLHACPGKNILHGWPIGKAPKPARPNLLAGPPSPDYTWIFPTTPIRLL